MGHDKFWLPKKESVAKLEEESGECWLIIVWWSQIGWRLELVVASFLLDCTNQWMILSWEFLDTAGEDSIVEWSPKAAVRSQSVIFILHVLVAWGQKDMTKSWSKPNLWVIVGSPMVKDWCALVMNLMELCQGWSSSSTWNGIRASVKWGIPRNHWLCRRWGEKASTIYYGIFRIFCTRVVTFI